MDSAVPGGSIAPPSQDVVVTDTLIAEEDEGFECLYDVPFVTVNRVAGLIEAEVLLCGAAEIDLDRINTALSVGRSHGYTSYSRVFGEADNVLIQFTDDPDKGLIWALEDDLGLPAW